MRRGPRGASLTAAGVLLAAHVALVSRLALTHTPGTTYRELAPQGPHRQLYAATLTDTTLTPLVAAFLRLLHDVAGDITATWTSRAR